MYQVIEESQSKKISKYIDASVMIKWYKENQQKLSDILQINISDLPSLDKILEDSYFLIKQVINPQSSGNNNENTKFEDFEKLNKIIVHDFLHNLYNATAKNFNKTLTNLEFSIDEIVEEIECLAIEESFNKYMNVKAVKQDFVNQNINQLASYLIVTFIKNHPEDFYKITMNEEEPFLYIENKKVYLNGTSFEGIGLAMQNIPQKNQLTDRSYDYGKTKYYSNSKYGVVNTQQEFIDLFLTILTDGDFIDKTGGDRAQYPDGNWGGNDLSEFELPDDRYIEAIYDTYHSDSAIYEDLTFHNGVSMLDVDVYKDNLLEYIDENSDIGLLSSIEEFEEQYSYNKIIEIIGFIPSTKIEEDKFQHTRYGNTYDYILFDEEMKPFSKDDLSEHDDSFYEIIDNIKDYYYVDYFKDELYQEYEKLYKDKPIELIKRIVAYPQSTECILLRRFFRSTDVLRNVVNTKKSNNKSIENIKDGPQFFYNINDGYKSLSKHLFTDRAKKLNILLDNFRGYLIKNFKELKTRFNTNYKNNKLDYFINALNSIDIGFLSTILDILSQYTYERVLKITFTNQYFLIIKAKNGNGINLHYQSNRNIHIVIQQAYLLITKYWIELETIEKEIIQQYTGDFIDVYFLIKKNINFIKKLREDRTDVIVELKMDAIYSILKSVEYQEFLKFIIQNLDKLKIKNENNIINYIRQNATSIYEGTFKYFFKKNRYNLQKITLLNPNIFIENLVKAYIHRDTRVYWSFPDTEFII
jgi:hypothetical protein